MDARLRELNQKAWTSAAAMGRAVRHQARVATGWAQRRAAHYAPASILRRRQRARQWLLLRDAATVAAAYGARAAVRRFLPAARVGRGPSKA